MTNAKKMDAIQTEAAKECRESGTYASATGIVAGVEVRCVACPINTNSKNQVSFNWYQGFKRSSRAKVMAL